MTTREFKFSNGDVVFEKITGFKGTITGTCYYLTGCNQYLVTAQSKDGAEPVAIWYDEGRLTLVEKEKFNPNDVSGKENGCDILPTFGKRGH